MPRYHLPDAAPAAQDVLPRRRVPVVRLLVAELVNVRQVRERHDGPVDLWVRLRVRRVRSEEARAHVAHPAKMEKNI